MEDIELTVYNIPFIFDYFVMTSGAFKNLEQLVRNEVGCFLDFWINFDISLNYCFKNMYPTMLEIHYQIFFQLHPVFRDNLIEYCDVDLTQAR